MWSCSLWPSQNGFSLGFHQESWETSTYLLISPDISWSFNILHHDIPSIFLLTSNAGPPDEHGFPAGFIPTWEHPPCIHGFELSQSQGFPPLRALVSLGSKSAQIHQVMTAKTAIPSTPKFLVKWHLMELGDSRIQKLMRRKSYLYNESYNKNIKHIYI